MTYWIQRLFNGQRYSIIKHVSRELNAMIIFIYDSYARVQIKRVQLVITWCIIYLIGNETEYNIPSVFFLPRKIHFKNVFHVPSIMSTDCKNRKPNFSTHCTTNATSAIRFIISSGIHLKRQREKKLKFVFTTRVNRVSSSLLFGRNHSYKTYCPTSEIIQHHSYTL